MKKFQGKGVYGAIAVGSVSVFKRQEAQVRRVHIDDTAAELERLENAKAQAISQLSEIYEKALKEVGETHAQIFEIHMMMIEDDDYNDSIKSIIETQSVNAEYAVAVTSDNFADMFASMDDAYMQARSADVRDISNRVIACLSGGGAGGAAAFDKMIVCADDLAPSETVSLDKDKVLAFVTAFGSSNSHTAILARNMNIPAVISVGEDFLAQIKDGDRMIVDGHTGTVILDPDNETVKTCLDRQAQDARKKALLQELKGKENVTKDGTHIKIFANIGGVDGAVEDAALHQRLHQLRHRAGRQPQPRGKFFQRHPVGMVLEHHAHLLDGDDLAHGQVGALFQHLRERQPAQGLGGRENLVAKPQARMVPVYHSFLP